MLAKNPADRPASALEVAQRLALFAAGTANSRSRSGGGVPTVLMETKAGASEPGQVPSLAAWLANRRLWLNLGIGGGLLLCLIGVVWLAGLIFSGTSVPESSSPPANQGAGAPAPGDKSEGPKGTGKPSPLESRGPKETDDVLVMPAIAADEELARGKPGDKVFLSDMQEFALKAAPPVWSFAKQGRVADPQNLTRKILVKGSAYPRGLAMHPPFTDYLRVGYALAGRAASLYGAVALDDGEDGTWPIKTTTLVVLGDGKVLWRSQGIKDHGVIEPFTVNVRGVRVLELRVYTEENGANGSCAVWLDPYVVVGR
jgi:hypothetical protein